MVTKKNLSEDDTSAKFITPALYKAGWDEAAIRRQVAFTAGRIIVRGNLCAKTSKVTRNDSWNSGNQRSQYERGEDPLATPRRTTPHRRQSR